MLAKVLKKSPRHLKQSARLSARELILLQKMLADMLLLLQSKAGKHNAYTDFTVIHPDVY